MEGEFKEIFRDRSRKESLNGVIMVTIRSLQKVFRDWTRKENLQEVLWD